MQRFSLQLPGQQIGQHKAGRTVAGTKPTAYLPYKGTQPSGQAQDAHLLLCGCFREEAPRVHEDACHMLV